MMAWALTGVECASALERLLRERTISVKERDTARQHLDVIESRWTEISDLHLVRPRARRLLRSYPLAAADSLQLAAALEGCHDRPQDMPFATLDRRLAAAAAREGFTTVG